MPFQSTAASAQKPVLSETRAKPGIESGPERCTLQPHPPARSVRAWRAAPRPRPSQLWRGPRRRAIHVLADRLAKNQYLRASRFPWRLPPCDRTPACASARGIVHFAPPLVWRLHRPTRRDGDDPCR